MDTFTLKRFVGEDGILHIELPVGVYNTDVEVVVVVQSSEAEGTSKRTRRMTEAKRKHPRAYEPWTAEEEQKLIEMHNAGLPIKSISEQLQRQSGAIRSRLDKLNGKS